MTGPVGPKGRPVEPASGAAGPHTGPIGDARPRRRAWVPPGERPRVLVVVGTRPEAIKMAPVLAALHARADEVEASLVLTGQHSELVDQVLARFGLVAAWNLEIMRPGQTLYDVIRGSLDGLRDVLARARPHALLVEGDTGSVFAGALAGFLEGVWVGHVEAGLRSHDKWAPWPEEMFRRLTDVLADGWFAPTRGAADNLCAEGIPADRVHVTGNTVVDALHTFADADHRFADETLARVAASGRRLVLLTAHRREAFGEPLREVFGAVRALADAEPDIDIVYPMHPNPNVGPAARALLSDHPRIHLTEPIDYLDLVGALRRAALVLTDSGGIQEEAPAFGVPVLVLRDVTERPEGIAAGVAELVGTDGRRILERARARLAAGAPGGAPPPNPYGDGRAGERIADLVVSELAVVPRRTTDWSGA
jgi:UDP-N-acetylglucosamine 2-epimerase (non-hydrolysing)